MNKVIVHKCINIGYRLDENRIVIWCNKKNKETVHNCRCNKFTYRVSDKINKI